jgi:hypothetical protein
MRFSARCIALVLATVLVPALANAQSDKSVVYRLVDKNGKTSYSDKAPPRGFEGKVTRIEVDLKANRATLNAVGGSSAPVTLPLTAPELRRVKADAELARANEALEAAKKALEVGKEPQEGDVQLIGKVGGGARQVPTEDYHKRIKKLEDAVQAAEAEVDRARTAARQAAVD